VAPRLKAENVPVILTSTMSAPPRSDDGYDEAYATPAALYKAGVKFAIAGDGTRCTAIACRGMRAWRWRSVCRKRKRSRR
jgi:hypothetical protein